LAQSETTGAIRGSIHEAGNPQQPIAGAIVTAKNEETGLTRTSLTGPDGAYFIGLLPPGSYKVTGSHPDYEDVPPNSSINKFLVKLAKANLVQPPPIALRRRGTAPPAAPTPSVPATAPPGASITGDEAEQLVNTTDAARGGNFDRRQLTTLPLAGIRTFESLAFLLPGVAPPPQPLSSTVGPGIGAGIGTSGQFSVNG
jgi:hypothetical protein